MEKLKNGIVDRVLAASFVVAVMWIALSMQGQATALKSLAQSAGHFPSQLERIVPHNLYVHLQNPPIDVRLSGGLFNDNTLSGSVRTGN